MIYLLLFINIALSQTNYIPSRIDGLRLALHSYEQKDVSKNKYVLLLHGSSFPSMMSYGFRIDGKSWIDDLFNQGFNVYALDFLGYGRSDKYPEMLNYSKYGKPLGTAEEVVQDVEKVVSYILKENNIHELDIISHSWGSLVARMYAERYSEKVRNLVVYAGIAKRKSELKNDKIRNSYNEIEPNVRLRALNDLAPDSLRPLLAGEVIKMWSSKWTTLSGERSTKIKYPAGPALDVYQLTREKVFYNSLKIKSNVLIVRGEFDHYPTNKESYDLFKSLMNAKSKKYIVLQNGTHVMHLEKNRVSLFRTVSDFLNSE